MQNQSAIKYDRSFFKVDDVTGDNTKAAAEFNLLQLGFYVQDDCQINDAFKLTFGIRMDIPMYLDDPAVNMDFNENFIPCLERRGIDLHRAKTGQMPNTSLLFSTRVGFNWDVYGDKSMQLRGGAGLFTSRIPYVWPGGAYNNGMTVGGMRVKTPGSPELVFNPKWDEQPGIALGPSGQVDLFVKDFKMPQIFRANVALDKRLPLGIQGTFDVTYTKNVNNVTYQNLFAYDGSKKMTGTGDDQIIWDNIKDDVNDNAEGNYTGVFLGSNTSKGYSFNFMTQLSKIWYNNLFASVAYNYGVAKSVNDVQSS